MRLERRISTKLTPQTLTHTCILYQYPWETIHSVLYCIWMHVYECVLSYVSFYVWVSVPYIKFRLPSFRRIHFWSIKPMEIFPSTILWMNVWLHWQFSTFLITTIIMEILHLFFFHVIQFSLSSYWIYKAKNMLNKSFIVCFSSPKCERCNVMYAMEMNLFHSNESLWDWYSSNKLDMKLNQNIEQHPRWLLCDPI